MEEPHALRQPSEKLRLVVRALTEAEIPYAVGGAIAAGVWSEPRDTQDIDIDIFLGESEATRVFEALRPQRISALIDEYGEHPA